MTIINGTLVKLAKTEQCLALSTYSRKHGRIGRFLIDADSFSEWFACGEGEFYDKDIGFIFAKLSGNHVRIRMLWYHGSYNGYTTYADQTIEIPVTAVQSALAGESVQHLYIEDSTLPKLDFSFAAKTIQEICQDKRKRRAFSKVVLDSFQWRRSSLVTFSNDSPAGSFFFRERGGMCGGFILHQSKKQTKIGEVPYCYYSVHT